MNIKKTLFNLVSILTLSVLINFNAQATLLYSNGSGTVQGINSDAGNIHADDFTLAADSILESVIWSGFYFPNNTPLATDAFTVRIYADNSGSVGSLLNTITPGNMVNRVDSGSTFSSTYNIYNYEADLGSLSLGSGTYWLSIFNNTLSDPNDNWFWSVNCNSSPSCDGSQHSADDGASWSSTNADASFALHGTEVAPVPIPAAVWLMGSALMGLVGFRRKRST